MNNGDSGDDFKILDIAEGPEGDGGKGMNILDDVEKDKDETKKGEKDETKTLPHIGGVSGQQQTDENRKPEFDGNRAADIPIP